MKKNHRRNDLWKWCLGLVFTSALAISGWLFGGLQSANAQTHEQIINHSDKGDEIQMKLYEEIKIELKEIKTDIKIILKEVR